MKIIQILHKISNHFPSNFIAMNGSKNCVFNSVHGTLYMYYNIVC